jgi:hypothetical protein
MRRLLNEKNVLGFYGLVDSFILYFEYEKYTLKQKHNF